MHNDSGMSAALREIVVLKMADEAGALDALLKAIVEAGVNFANAYGRVVNEGGNAFFMIDVQDIPDARAKLAKVGLAIIGDAQVYGVSL